MKIPVALLSRVSTQKQNTDRQESELAAIAEQRGWTVVASIKETISGNARQDERDGLNQVMELAKAGRIKKVLVHEVSRLARKPSIVHKAVEELAELGVSLYWNAQSVETLLPSGKMNPAAAIMLAVLAEMARAERETTIERINSGLAHAKANGVKLGRPAGQVSTEKFLEAHKATVAFIKKNPGLSIRNLAKLTEKAPGTIVRIQRALA